MPEHARLVCICTRADGTRGTYAQSLPDAAEAAKALAWAQEAGSWDTIMLVPALAAPPVAQEQLTLWKDNETR